MSAVRTFLDRVMAESPRGPVDALAVIAVVALLACAVTIAVRIARNR